MNLKGSSSPGARTLLTDTFFFLRDTTPHRDQVPPHSQFIVNLFAALTPIQKGDYYPIKNQAGLSFRGQEEKFWAQVVNPDATRKT